MEPQSNPVESVNFVEFDIGLTAIMFDVVTKTVAAYSLNHILAMNRLSLIEARDVPALVPIAVVDGLESAEKWMRLNGVVIEGESE